MSSGISGNVAVGGFTALLINSKCFLRFLCLFLSFDEFAKYDLPACIEFALRCSQKQKLSYIGHSQGTTIVFAAFSTNQTLAEKIELFVALAPVANVTYMESPIKYLSFASGPIQVRNSC